MPACEKHQAINGMGVDDSFLCVYCEIDRLREELEQVKSDKDSYFKNWQLESKIATKYYNELANERKAVEWAAKHGLFYINVSDDVDTELTPDEIRAKANEGK